MSEELALAMREARALFRKKWAERIQQNNYDFEVAFFDARVKRRHQTLWEHLTDAVNSGNFEQYLGLLEEEGRLQARASTRLEALLTQLCTMMNLLWEVASSTSSVRTNPALLRPLTERLNVLRTRATDAILRGYNAENRLIQDEQAAESSEMRRLRLEQTSLKDLVKAVQAFRITRFHEGSHILQPGSYNTDLYFIMSGKIRIYEILPDGRSITLSILGVNDVFAQSNNHNSYFHDVYADAMQDSIVANIRESSLERLMEDAPLLATRIIYSFSQQLSQSQVLIEGLLGRDISLRLVNILLKLASEFGVARPDGSVSIELELTHQELADMIGSNRVTITRKLLELQKKKLIDVQKHTISILDLQTLEEMVA
ncbi:MAG TPA: Crp/Fnr family transcriptional regulator [Chloroflexia bacterium]|nr:Crp/Fnr family transcriptional regulator [Chloroflexia bacterium]